jgi:hypothetical protein
MDDWAVALSTGCFYQQSIPICPERIKDDRFDSSEVGSVSNCFRAACLSNGKDL